MDRSFHTVNKHTAATLLMFKMLIEVLLSIFRKSLNSLGHNYALKKNIVNLYTIGMGLTGVFQKFHV